MSKQIAVRLPDDLVDFVDNLVAEGHEASRASFVARAITRERRRMSADRDVAILKSLAGASVYPDLDGLSEWAGRRPSGID